MTTYPRVREQHIAVFGEGGSGKTVLVSSFFGPTQTREHANDLWDLVADDTGQGNRLLRNFVGMRDRSTAPAPTRFASTTYNFSVKLKGRSAAGATKRPFDTLRLAWHDYPGEWFTETPSSDLEADRRIDTFRSLIRSDVAFLLVDGQKLLDHSGEENRYLTLLLTNFRQGLLRLKDGLLAGNGPLVEFPRIWIIALSKADLFPDWDVDTFRDLVILHATDEVSSLRATIGEMVDSPEALSMGEDFMLLSSATFQLTQGGSPEPLEIDVTKRKGLELILPLACWLPLERRVQWGERMVIPRNVLDTLANGAQAIATVIVSKKFARLVGRLPLMGDNRAKALAQLLAVAAAAAGPELKKRNETARADHDYLTAMLTQFKLDLGASRDHGVLRNPK